MHPIDKRMVCFKHAGNITRSTLISCHILNHDPKLDVSCDEPLKPINIKRLIQTFADKIRRVHNSTLSHALL